MRLPGGGHAAGEGPVAFGRREEGGAAGSVSLGSIGRPMGNQALEPWRMSARTVSAPHVEPTGVSCHCWFA